MMNFMDYDFKGKMVYLSGPMTGHVDFNRRLFTKGAERLKVAGAVYVYNPADEASHGEDRHSHEWWMRRSLAELTQECGDGNGKPLYDCIALLPGFERSEGAAAELTCAIAIGIDTVRM